MSRRGPLRHRAFRNVFLARSASSVGDALIFIAFAFAVLRVGGSATQLGLLLALGTVVRLLLVLVAGVWADRLPRQLVMLTADVLRAGVELPMGALLVTHHATLWELAVAYAIHSGASAFFDPASSGLVPQLVPKDELQQANGLLQTSRGVPAIFGPMISGVLVAAFGPGWVFLVDAGSFVASALCLSLVRLPPVEPRAREPFLSELAVGWRELRARDWYWQNLVTHALWNFAWPMVNVLGPVIALHQLGGAKAWGWIAGAFGAGAVLGSLVALRVKPSRPLVVLNLLLTIAAVPLLLLSRPAPVWAIALAAVPAMAGLGLANAVWGAVVGARLPEHVLSRVNSYDWLISLVVNPAGVALAGPLSLAIGVRPTLYIAAGLIAVPSALVTLLPSVRGVTREPDVPAPAPA